MGVLYVRSAGAWVPITGASNDAAQGLLTKTNKAANQTFNNTTEALITTFVGLATNPAANRYTKVFYSLQFNQTAAATGSTWFFLTLRNGNTVGGTLLERHIYPWWTDNQNFGTTEVAWSGSFTSRVFAAGATVSLTWTMGGFNPTIVVGATSCVEMVDLGAV